MLVWTREAKWTVFWTDLYLKVEGNRSFGPKKCGLDATKDDLRQWNLQAETSQSRSERENWKLLVTHMLGM